MPAPSEGFVDAGGVRLRYLDWGGSGPPAVLLHATGFLARLWEPVALGLARRFRVYAYDARGHGDSDRPSGGYRWGRFVDDFRGFLDALALSGVTAIGHSMGGASAAHLAATRPEYVSAAVLIEPIIFPPARMAEDGGDARQRMVRGAARRRAVWPSSEELVRSYRKRPAFAGWDREVLRLYAEHGTARRRDGRIELKCPPAIESAVFAGGPSPETWDLLPRIRCPVLVLRGAGTEPHLAWAAAGVAERVPGARLVTVEGASHFLPMERPGTVVEEVLGFINEKATPK